MVFVRETPQGLTALLHLAPDIQEELLYLPEVMQGKAQIHERLLRPLTRELARVRLAGSSFGIFPTSVRHISESHSAYSLAAAKSVREMIDFSETSRHDMPNESKYIADVGILFVRLGIYRGQFERDSS